MSAFPENARTILTLVSGGKSPWDGWDLAAPAWNAKARASAYARRRDQIQACRTAGLLDEAGPLTEAGHAALRALARTEAVVG